MLAVISPAKEADPPIPLSLLVVGRIVRIMACGRRQIGKVLMVAPVLNMVEFCTICCEVRINEWRTYVVGKHCDVRDRRDIVGLFC